MKSSHIHLQRGDEGLLRDVDLAELAHALLAFLLLLQQLAFAHHVAAVAFRGNVLAEGAHGFARDDLAADRRLEWQLRPVKYTEKTGGFALSRKNYSLITKFLQELRKYAT